MISNGELDYNAFFIIVDRVYLVTVEEINGFILVPDNVQDVQKYLNKNRKKNDFRQFIQNFGPYVQYHV